ncbi:MAG: prepilin-type N-terminal cleavage/methylation domain-containing protein [Pyrinomonadaceae bacterium]
MRTRSKNKGEGRDAGGHLRGRASGFTMLEMTVAMVVLMVGLLALASAVGYALMAGNRGRNVTNTKLLIVSVLEQVENLRNTGELSFGQINNVGVVDTSGTAGVFRTGFNQITNLPGADGIYGTADDLANTNTALTGYEREIVITSLSTNLKKVQVTIRYPGGDGVIRSIKGISYLNNDARSNYVQ